MLQSKAVAPLLLRALLVSAAVLGLFSTAQAQGRIGVTQSIQNNPVGKPPGGVDRVLRVGTDVQANEIISTTDNDRAHLVFLDGTTLTIGPSSSMTIDKFVYDPTTQKGELAVNATKGVFRIIGGRISKTSTIAVTTPSATMGIRGLWRRRAVGRQPGKHDLDPRLWQQPDSDRKWRDPDDNCAGLVGDHHHRRHAGRPDDRRAGQPCRGAGHARGQRDGVRSDG
jgi:hypothetical protein